MGALRFEMSALQSSGVGGLRSTAKMHHPGISHNAANISVREQVRTITSQNAHRRNQQGMTAQKLDARESAGITECNFDSSVEFSFEFCELAHTSEKRQQGQNIPTHLWRPIAVLHFKRLVLRRSHSQNDERASH